VIFNRPYLLISTGHLKDLISSLATIEALQQKVAGASIDVLVRQGNESLLDNHPVIREILIWNPDKSGKHIRTKINAFIRKQNYQTIYATSNNQLTKAILKGIKKEIIRTFDSQWKKYFGFKGNYYPEGEKLSNRWAAFGKIASASYQTSSPAYYLTAKELKNSSPLKGNKFSLLLLDKKDLTNKQAEIKDVLDSIPDENAIYQWSRYPWKHPRLPGSRTVLNLSGKLGLLEIIDLLRSGDSFSFNEEYDFLTHWIKPE
jgi:ADP-heptose:LPS heptosyltransferase